MNHYVYRIDRPSTGEWYIGLRSTESAPLEDPYMGSGTLLRRKRTGSPDGWVKTVLVQVESREEAARIEGELIGLDQVADPLCLNLIPGGEVGTLGMARPAHVNWAISDSQRGRTVSDLTKSRQADGMRRFWATRRAADPTYGCWSTATGEDREELRQRRLCQDTTKALDRWVRNRYRHRVTKPTEDVDPYLPFGLEV